MLKGIDLYKAYGKIQVLKGVSIELNESEVTALTGSSGAGKTTLLQIMGTLDYPDSGHIYFEHNHLNILTNNQLAKFRNTTLGFVFQFHYLLNEFSAIENVMMPALIRGENKKNIKRKANELLDYLGMSDRSDHKPSELSGGEQQRISVARALMNDPKVILADEPTGNLDTYNGEKLIHLFLSMATERNITVFVATHNESFANLAHRTLKIKDGKLEQ